MRDPGSTNLAGRTIATNTLKPVALVGCEAFTQDGQAIIVTGLYDLVEHEPSDLSCGIPSSGWIICLAGVGDNELALFVDDYALWEQRDPSGYGAWLAEQRWAELAEEEYDHG